MGKGRKSTKEEVNDRLDFVALKMMRMTPTEVLYQDYEEKYHLSKNQLYEDMRNVKDIWYEELKDSSLDHDMAYFDKSLQYVAHSAYDSNQPQIAQTAIQVRAKLKGLLTEKIKLESKGNMNINFNYNLPPHLTKGITETG